MNHCIFCKIIDRKIPANIIYEDTDVLVFKDINPQAPIHVLIIPKKHIAMISDLEENDQVLMGKMVAAANFTAREMNIDKNGFRLVINNGRDGGQDVFHIHMHLLGGRRLKWPPG